MKIHHSGIFRVAFLGASVIALAIGMRRAFEEELPNSAVRGVRTSWRASEETEARDVAVPHETDATPSGGISAERPASSAVADSPIPSEARDVTEEDRSAVGAEPGYEAPGLPLAPVGAPHWPLPGDPDRVIITGGELRPPPAPPALPPLPRQPGLSPSLSASAPPGRDGVSIFGAATSSATGSSTATYPAQKTLLSLATADIKNLATSLGNDPVRILDHLRNKYDFDPTYAGWLKGPQETFFQKSGNAYDLSALLVAMLRSSGKQARFVRRWVDVPGATLAAWTGMETVEGAFSILYGGQLQIEWLWIWNAAAAKYELGARFPHVWVELSVNGVWKPLDPSFKSYTLAKGKNVAALAGLTGAGMNAALRTAATGNEDLGLVDTVNLESVLETVRRRKVQLHGYLQQSAPTLTGRQAMGGKTLVVKAVTALPSAPALGGAYAEERFDEIPHVDQHGVQLFLNGIAVGLRLPEMLHHRISVGYAGNSAADASALSAAGGLLRVNPATISLKFELKVGGTVVASSYAGSIGERLPLTVDYYRGAGFDARSDHEVGLGGMYSLVLATSQMPLEKIKRSRDRLSAALGANKPVLDEALAGESLHVTGLSYFKFMDVGLEYLAGSQNAVSTRTVSGALFGLDVLRGTAPSTLYVARRFMDLKRNSGWVYDRARGQAFPSWPLVVARGSLSSSMEHLVWDFVGGQPAVSTMQILQDAAETDVPIRGFGAATSESILPTLGLSSSEIAHVRARVAEGKRILIPTAEIKLGDFRGRGYVGYDRTTGAAGHWVFSALGGGVGRWGARGMTPAQQEANLKKEGGVLKAFLDGLIVGDFDKRPYTTTGSAISHAVGQFISGVFIYGDVRDAAANGKEMWDTGGKEGKLDFTLSVIGVVPVLGDFAKGSKAAANVAELAVKNADEAAALAAHLGKSVDEAADILSNLARSADDATDLATSPGLLDLAGATTHSHVNGLDVETIFIDNADELFGRLSINVADGSTLNRGLAGERMADLVASDRGWQGFGTFWNKNPTSPGIDRVYVDGDRFKIVEVKFMEGDANLTKSRLNTTVQGKQEVELSNNWLDKPGEAGDAIARSVQEGTLTPAQGRQLRDAIDAGKVDKEVIILKNNVDGKTISPRLGSNPELGTGSPAPINVTIVEVPKKLPPPTIVQ